MFAAGGGFGRRLVFAALIERGLRRRRARASAFAWWPPCWRWSPPPFPPRPTPPGPRPAFPLSIFAVAAFSVNMYTLPLDVFGGARAAFAVSVLVASYGASQAVDLACVRPAHRSARLRARHRHRGARAAWPPAPFSAHPGSDASEAAAQALDLRPARQRSRKPWWSTFCTGEPELCRRMAEEVRALVPDRRHFVATEENWPRAAPRAPALPHRPGARDAHAPAQRLAPRRVSAGAAQDPGLQLAPGAPPPAPQPGLVPVLARRAARPHLSAPLVVAVAAARAHAGHPRAIAFSKAAPARPSAAAWPCSRPISPTRSLTAARCASTTCCARSRANSTSSCSPSPMTAAGCPTADPAAGILRPRGAGRTSRATASRAGPRCCRPRCTNSALPAMRRAIADERRAFGFELLQVEYTQLARYAGDILVEHDVTFDLFGQIARRKRTLAAWWDWFRWRRFETRAVAPLPPRGGDVAQGRRVCSARRAPATVIENGVDLTRFQPAARALRPAPALHRLLPPLSQHRRLPLLHRTRLAAAARQVSADRP